jgi:hypothetical protein
MKTFTWIFLVYFSLYTTQSFAQCSNCNYSVDATHPLSGTPSNQTVCISGNVSNINLQNWNGNNTICVKPGATWTQNSEVNFSGNNNGSITIEIQSGATVIIGSNPNFNAMTIFNVASNGNLIFSSNVGSLQNNFKIGNNGTVEFKADYIEVSNPTVSIINNASGTIKHTGTNTFKFNNVGSIVNYGIMLFSNLLENQGTNAFENATSGTIKVQRQFFNHGAFENNGNLNMPCATGTGIGTAACKLDLGDKGDTKMFLNNKCLTINGDFNIGGLAMNNGTITVAKPSSGTGNLTVNKEMRGTGRVIVENGESRLNNDGKWGASQGFWDKTSYNGGNFDYNSSNFNQPGTIKIDKSANACATILPVTGLQLNAKQANGDVVLEWKTLTEQNTASFIIQKSKDGIQFSNLATVAAAGTSLLPKSYTYTDANVQLATAYYRVQLVDRDGQTTMSSIIAVRLKEQKAGIQVFPNPAYGQIYTSFEAAGTYTIDLIDAVGKTALSKKVTATNGQTVTTERPASLAKGMYILRVHNAANNNQQAFKIELK